MQFRSSIYWSHSFIVVGDDFNERPHNMGKEDNTKEHDNDSDDHFSCGNWIEVSIPNCRQRRKWEITRDDHSGVVILDSPNLLLNAVFVDVWCYVQVIYPKFL